ncbi:hypothetical protein [Halopiger aswanensis]|uniref:Uncharacterized protein n=1 Tax=Halopiger aswanensis TaxID=148449 RepID=A0A419WQV6_9EURY|nr:hypothetical protein [Halopiger aswanensis]RKD97814.1 hypothetical protein ATJ93_0806 [Halopiger aswanensis]
MVLVSSTVLVTVPRRLRRFWSFYRRYTATAIHTAATAALAIFGILVFVDPWFAALAIGSYLVPPVFLYTIGAEPPSPGDDVSSTERSEADAAVPDRTRSADPIASTPETGRSRGGTDTDTDTDSDGGNGDTDSDSDSDDGDTDTDSDSDDGDTDSDSDSDS